MPNRNGVSPRSVQDWPTFIIALPYYPPDCAPSSLPSSPPQTPPSTESPTNSCRGCLHGQTRSDHGQVPRWSRRPPLRATGIADRGKAPNVENRTVARSACSCQKIRSGSRRDLGDLMTDIALELALVEFALMKSERHLVKSFCPLKANSSVLGS